MKAFLGLVMFLLFEVLLVLGGLFSIKVFSKTIFNIIFQYSLSIPPETVKEESSVISKIIMLHFLFFGSTVFCFTIVASWVLHLLREISGVLKAK
jgi:hypothetical protein